MKSLNSLLNKITMYRLVVYVLSILAGLAITYAFLGRGSASPTALVVSLFLLVTSAYVVDRGCGKYFDAPTNMESSLITGLILFLILQPVSGILSGATLVLAGAVSSASKFLIARNGKHIFNPAALAAALLSLTGLHAVTWWVGSSVLWPYALILGLVVVKKIRRLPLFSTFFIVSSVLQLIVYAHAHQPILIATKSALLASPLIFLSTIMLTEPATMPPRRNQQLIFASLVAVLYVMAWSIGPFSIYPEVALLIGNIYAYAVSPKFRVLLQLKEIQKISDRVYNYIFTPDRAFEYLPGQYMEWTLENVPYDSRGNRRTFTIASSPTEKDIQLGLKYYEPASAFKAAFYNLNPGDYIFASQLAGNFTLDTKKDQKLAFIAGGIGITPFRSMIKYVTDLNLTCDIVLVYVVSNPEEFAYVEVFNQAAKAGIKIIPVVSNPKYKSNGFITAKVSADLLSKLIPDYNERSFYISGSNEMVDSSKAHLLILGVERGRIKTDHFTGY